MAKSNDKIVNACETHWDHWKGDCSGFVKAVAAEMSIQLSGQANHIIDYLESSPSWTKLGHDSRAGMQQTKLGHLVIAGLKASGHGHVAIIVNAPQRQYPTGYWGRYGACGRKNMTINWSWNAKDLQRVQYSAIPV